MRRRLIVLLVLLMGCVLAVLSVALGRNLAASRQQAMFVDRLQDTSQFADTAQQATSAVALMSLWQDIETYSELYGVTAAVVGQGGTVWAVSGSADDLRRADTVERINQARVGRPSTAPPTIWPWQDDPVVVAVPVTRGDNVIAVAVTVSSTAGLHTGLMTDLLLLLLADLAAMVLLVVLASRLANWVLRPVFVLDAAARRISSGDLSVRVGATGPVELRRLADTFNGMATAVDLAMQRQEAFVGDASHQLRNPLAALVLRLDALAMGLDDERREQVRLALDEANRLDAILTELLELATAVHVTARPVPVDLVELVDARLEAWRPVADRQRVVLTQAAPVSPVGTNGGSVQAMVDPVLVSSALDAVLDNALKFTPEGGRVATRVVAEAQTVAIDVADNGPGVSEADLRHIGHRFWRSASSQNIPGSGLGLSIARTLLQTTGSEILFTAGRPTGLRVLIRMPRVQGVGGPT